MNPDRRVIVYPQYIDANKSVADGRRIPKEQACEDPFVSEIDYVCKQLKLESQVELKHYPRDWLPKGRVRVQLKGEDGKPTNPEIPDRRTLLLKLAELVKKHPERVAGKRKQSAAAKASEAGPSGSGAGAASSNKPAPSKKGKKGKK